jgi:hypothetical protein
MKQFIGGIFLVCLLHYGAEARTLHGTILIGQSNQRGVQNVPYHQISADLAGQFYYEIGRVDNNPIDMTTGECPVSRMQDVARWLQTDVAYVPNPVGPITCGLTVRLGHWVTLYRHLYTHFDGGSGSWPQVVILCAYGGASLNRNGLAAPNVNLEDRCMQIVSKVKTTIESQGDTVQWEVLDVFRGESDTYYDSDADMFQFNMMLDIYRWRNFLGVPNLPILWVKTQLDLTKMSASNAAIRGRNLAKIRTAEKNVAADDQCIALINQDDLARDDWAHLSPTSEAAVGSRAYAALRSLQDKQDGKGGYLCRSGYTSIFRNVSQVH